jgi:methylated-DNA-[protein]-cysteine S-methyltransferase
MKRPPAAPYQAILCTPLFGLGIRASADEITGLDYLPGQPELAPQTPLAAEAVRQIRAYLADPAFAFGLPLRPQGTLFQRRVWGAIAEIPCGAVESYGAVAKKIRSGPRAVGGACGANPYPLVVPCHRVVSAAGLGGFGGVGGAGAGADFLLDIKRWLLTHEGLGPL